MNVRTWRRIQSHHQRRAVENEGALKRKVTDTLSWFDYDFWYGIISFKFRRLITWRNFINEAAEPDDDHHVEAPDHHVEAAEPDADHHMSDDDNI